MRDSFFCYYPRVYNFFNCVLNNNEESEDLAQDVFTKLWKYRVSLKQVQNLNAYIYRVAKNTLYTYLDRKINVSSINIDNVREQDSLDDIENLVYSHELQSLIDKVIDRMPSQQKQVFCMSRRDGLSNDEIASRLNISKRTVETHISVALSTLRKVTSALSIFF